MSFTKAQKQIFLLIIILASYIRKWRRPSQYKILRYKQFDYSLLAYSDATIHSMLRFENTALSSRLIAN